MKKFIVLALLAVMASGAYASSVAIPWFNDFAAAASGGGDLPPSGGGLFGLKGSTYITLKNNTEDDLLCEIIYTDKLGRDMTPDPNTFVINAKAAIGFRPYRDDATEAPLGLVGNCTVVEPWVGGEVLPAGSAKVSFVGDPKDVQGMVTMHDTAINASSSYLLPEGK